MREVTCNDCNNQPACFDEPMNVKECQYFDNDKLMKQFEQEEHDKRVIEEAKKGVRQIIENVCETICDNFCEYRVTCDENNECQWIREGNKCPLDDLI